MLVSDAHEGADRAQVERWLGARVDGLALPLEIRVITGGRSNLTYLVTASDGRRFVLRRPPLHGVLPSAHDVAREHRIQVALAATGVPVPGIIGLEEDPAVLGAPFYVMEHVDGFVLRDPADVETALDLTARARAGASMVEALHRLHALDPAGLGLTSGSSGPYVARQLRAWGRQLEALSSDDDTRTGALLALGERLSQRMPTQQATAIVHGDYRLDNVIFAVDGEVRAILDWELWTVGDPLADVAILAAYWVDPDDALLPLGVAGTVALGLASRAQVVDLYRASSPLDFSRFDFYLAFATWRLAAILEGVLQRFRSGAYGQVPSSEWEGLLTAVPGLTAQAAAFERRDAGA